MIANYIFLLQEVNAEEQVSTARETGYEIGYAIGTYFPYVFLVGLAYFIYYKAKNRKDLED